MIPNCLNDLGLVCFTEYVLGFKEGRRMGLSSYDNTYSMEISPYFDITWKRWNRRA
ncbi:hypothetical protein DPMN_166968 [Dreissena polymorpha]|uniref:Uncharacterized protein n=1 Tax=Dreissena polymorpha TaxID=45954 RepID=A0A9D4EZV2_DREPO|nr:hypothetical protein DPMN_166968 [Dreissena polymorpha]